MNSRERDFKTKKEVDLNFNNLPKITSSSSRQWSCHKNPRIVRVSRTFGGKDRHSKVCTVRGLRDRRIRLSVPTAIQLYDLQDRLGLSQPSKVVDWLLDATKLEIDKLPPLPMIPGGNFTQPHQPTQLASAHQSLANPQASLSHLLGSNHQSAKNLGFNPSKEGIASQHEQENQEGFGGFVAQLSAHNLFPLNNNQSSSFANLPYNSYFHLDPPSLSLSQIGGALHPLSNQTDQDQSQNNLSTILNSNSQLYFCPSATTIPSIIPSFPSYITPSIDNDWRQMNNLQNPLLPTTLHLISSPMKSFALNVNSKSVHLQQNDKDRREKDNRS